VEKKKLKVLKNALKEERATREQVEKDLKTALDKVEQQKQQLTDKVTIHDDLMHFPCRMRNTCSCMRRTLTYRRH